MADYPQLLHTVLDTPEVRQLAEFYRQLLGLQYRPGDEPPVDENDDADWLVLTDAQGNRTLAFETMPAVPLPAGVAMAAAQMIWTMGLIASTTEEIQLQNPANARSTPREPPH